MFRNCYIFKFCFYVKRKFKAVNWLKFAKLIQKIVPGFTRSFFYEPGIIIIRFYNKLYSGSVRKYL